MNDCVTKISVLINSLCFCVFLSFAFNNQMRLKNSCSLRIIYFSRRNSFWASHNQQTLNSKTTKGCKETQEGIMLREETRFKGKFTSTPFSISRFALWGICNGYEQIFTENLHVLLIAVERRGKIFNLKRFLYPSTPTFAPKTKHYSLN